MASASTAPYLFGDLLALARLSWVRQMGSRLAQLGYHDYRRSDAAALRLLRRGPVPVGRIGAELGITRQAARKVAEGLEQRDYARTERDARDSRVLNVILTAAGTAYAQAITDVIRELNREFRERVDPAELAAADSVLRAVFAGDAALESAAAAIRTPAMSAPAPGSHLGKET
jgi:DNA-binding MarR family transcriptional regulator